MQALLQILKVNPIKEGKSAKTGKDYRIQDCECLLLDENGLPSQIGVLTLNKEMTGNVKEGIYTGSFSLRPDLMTRRIEAVLTGLVPAPIKQRIPSAPAAAA